MTVTENAKVQTVTVRIEGFFSEGEKTTEVVIRAIDFKGDKVILSLIVEKDEGFLKLIKKDSEIIYSYQHQDRTSYDNYDFIIVDDVTVNGKTYQGYQEAFQ